MKKKVDLPQVISHPSILWGPPPPSENPVSSDISVAIFFLSCSLSLSLFINFLQLKKKHLKIEHRPNNHRSAQIKIRKKKHVSCKHKFFHFSSTHPSICPLTVNTHIKPRQSLFACHSFRVGEIQIVKIFPQRCSIIYSRAFFNRLMATRFLQSFFHFLSFIELKSIKSLKSYF